MQNLFNITEEWIRIMQDIEAADGEITPEIQTKLELNDVNLKTKLDGYVKVIHHFSADVDTIDAEIKRLQALKQTKTKSVDNLKQRMSDSLQMMGVEKYDGGLFKLTFRTTQAVEVTDISLLPKEYIRIKEEADKTAIKTAIASGVEVRGASLKTNKNIQIK